MNLMIIDDENIVRQGIKRILSRDNIGVAVAGEAGTYEEAVSLFKDLRPDIVLCDIRLPGGSGFDIIESVKGIVPWVQFIMISAYSDKNYLKKAFHLNVCDYLFKPTQPDDIKAAISKAITAVNEYQKQKKTEREYRSFIEDNLPLLQENLLWKLLTEEIDENAFRDDAARLHLFLSGPYYCLLSVDTTESSFFEICQKLTFSCSSYSPLTIEMKDGSGDLIVLLNVASEAAYMDLRENLEKDHYRFNWISGLLHNLEEVSGVFQKQRASVFKDNEEQENLSFHDLCHVLQEAILYHDSAEEISRLFGLFLQEAADVHNFQDVLDQYRQIAKMAAMVADVSSDLLSSVNDLSDIEASFSGLLTAFQNDLNHHSSDAVKKALYNIRKHFREDYSLNQLSADLFMSVSYVSRIIKERTGHGFNYWLNYYRIEAAKDYLKDPSVSIEDVSSAAGYNSYRIFCKNFRRYEGCTASEYRKQ